MKTVKFLNYRIYILKKVFIPRPETEFWTKLAIKEIKNSNKKKIRVLDIFAGTGCIGIAVLKDCPELCRRVDFADIDEKVLEQIKINLEINKIEKGRYRIIKSDIFEKIRGRYDFILANPPYVALERISEVQPGVLREEPHLALFGGKDGLDHIRRFLKEVKNYLKPRGKFYLEFDPQQKPEIEKILRRHPPTTLPPFGRAPEKLKFKFHRDQFKKWRLLIGYK